MFFIRLLSLPDYSTQYPSHIANLPTKPTTSINLFHRFPSPKY